MFRKRSKRTKRPARNLEGHFMVNKGVKAPPEEIFHIFCGDAILVREDGKTAENFSFLLDPTKKPKEIDLTLREETQRSRHLPVRRRHLENLYPIQQRLRPDRPNSLRRRIAICGCGLATDERTRRGFFLHQPTNQEP
jgi:hypothetical protein